MTLSQLTCYIDQSRDLRAAHEVQQALRARHKPSKRDKALRNGSRYVFDGVYTKLPLVVLRPIHYDDFELCGQHTGSLLQFLLRRVGGANLSVTLLDNPGLSLNDGLCFGMSGWDGTNSLTLSNAVDLIGICFRFLTILDVQELFDELPAAVSAKSVA